jgi:hypothetical protein
MLPCKRLILSGSPRLTKDVDIIASKRLPLESERIIGQLKQSGEHFIVATEGSLTKTNGEAVIDGDLIYTSANSIIRAISKIDGSIKWQTKDFGKGGIAEMQLWGDTIYGRMGGQFFSSKKGEYQKKTPIGVVAHNKTDGSEK